MILGRPTEPNISAAGVLMLGACLLLSAGPRAAEPSLVLQYSIPLGAVAGRIDHLALDPQRQRLFIAELGNNSLGVVDLNEKKVIASVAGIEKPQGVAYVPWTDAIAVASGGDGALHFFGGDDLKAVGSLPLGSDADNVLLDPDRKQLVVAYGDALALVDPAGPTKAADVPLRAHPEGLDRSGATVLVNIPGAREIAVVDLEKAAQTSSWATEQQGSNFPMAIDTGAQRAIAVFRNPPALGAFDLSTGKAAAAVAVCGDADNVFADSQRHRLYVSCGDGYIDVFEVAGGSYTLLEEIETAAGARTALFDQKSGAYYLAVPAREGQEAALWVYRVQ